MNRVVRTKDNYKFLRELNLTCMISTKHKEWTRTHKDTQLSFKACIPLLDKYKMEKIKITIKCVAN